MVIAQSTGVGGALSGLCVLMTVLAACRDDDAALPDAGPPRPPPMDASPAAADASREEDAGEIRDAAPPYDCADGSVELYGFGAERLPLTRVCTPRTPCPQSLAAFTADMTCVAYVDDEESPDARSPWDYFDAGSHVLWIRREGCGSVQFVNLGELPQTYYNFDSATGDFLGVARFDDIGLPIKGTPCTSAGVVAGSVRTACDEVVAFLCDPG